MQYDVDLCVIGTGPGGYVAAIRAAQLGMRVAVVEREELGGVCLNRGCIPTKAMLRSAEVFSTVKRAAEFGVQAESVRVDYGKVLERKDRVVRQLVAGIGGLLKSHAVEIIRGSGRLAERGKVVVTGEADATINANNVIVATGSIVANPQIPGTDGPGVIDSDGALELEELPERILVVGSGAVGSEWAALFNELGSRVTLVEMMPTLVPLEDEDIGKALARSFTRHGMAVHVGAKLEQVSDSESGKKVGTVTLKDGRQERVETDLVLMAVGRRPNTEGLGADALGVTTDGRGAIEVDDQLRTSAPNVFAIGDVTGKVALAHVASHQGIVAAEVIAGHDKRINYKAVPAVTFTHPEVASVGLTERAARDRGLDVRVGMFPLAGIGRAIAYGDTDGMVKIVADAKYGELLGVHIVGPQAGDMIPEAVLGIQLEATLDDITGTIHAHPTLAESVMEAAWAAAGGAIHLPKPRQQR